MITASIRLTNRDRDGVVDAAVTGAFKAKKAALAAASDALARKCYEAVFPAPVRKAVKAMPEGWLHLDKCLRFNVGGLTAVLKLTDVGLPVPSCNRSYCERLGSVADEAIVAEVRAHLDAEESLKTEISKARSSLKALLYSVSTVKALRELWPEGESYFSGLIGKTGAPGLPAPQITELNALLGLAQEAA